MGIGLESHLLPIVVRMCIYDCDDLFPRIAERFVSKTLQVHRVFGMAHPFSKYIHYKWTHLCFRTSKSPLKSPLSCVHAGT